MPRKIPGPATVCFCRGTGLAEVSDEVFALGQLLFPEAQHGSDTFQGKWQAHIRGPDHGALPCSRIEVVSVAVFRIAIAGIVKTTVIPEPAREAYPLKLRVERPLCYHVVCQRGNDLIWNRLPGSEVDHLHRPSIGGVAEEQDVEIRCLGVFVDSALRQLHAAVCFNVDTECFHIDTSVA